MKSLQGERNQGTARGVMSRAWAGIWLVAAPVAALYAGDPNVITVRDFTLLRSRPDTVFALEFFAGAPQPALRASLRRITSSRHPPTATTGWCGHCQAFAPVWKQAAASACAASPSLVFGAMDCASDYVLCRSMGITGYPAIRLYGRGFGPTGVPLRACGNGCFSKLTLLDDILSTARAAFAAASAGSPGLRPLPLLSSPPVSPLTGARLAAASASECAGLPPAASDQAAGTARFDPPIEMQQRPVPMADIASAVAYGIQRELVKIELGPPASERRSALDAWLAALAALLPGPANRANMLRLRSAARARESLSPEAWEQVVLSTPPPLLPDGSPAGAIAWAACRGATPDARGYPCGLWLLFHSLLAQARTDAEAAAALRAIKGYVQFFFGCTGCSQHFLAMARAEEDSLERAARTAADARLWLWRAHNTVNRRLNVSVPEQVKP